jgi:hypothetical protein
MGIVWQCDNAGITNVVKMLPELIQSGIWSARFFVHYFIIAVLYMTGICHSMLSTFQNWTDKYIILLNSQHPCILKISQIVDCWTFHFQPHCWQSIMWDRNSVSDLCFVCLSCMISRTITLRHSSSSSFIWRKLWNTVQQTRWRHATLPSCLAPHWCAHPMTTWWLWLPTCHISAELLNHLSLMWVCYSVPPIFSLFSIFCKEG